MLSVRKEWKSLYDKTAIKDTLITTFLLGIVYYLLFFFGLKYTSAGNAGIIALTEILFSFLFFHVLKKEHTSASHVAGMILMMFGATIVLFPNVTTFNKGDLLILTASGIAPIGNFFQRRARQTIGSNAILFIRSVLTTLFVLAFALFLDTEIPSSPTLVGSLLFLFINGTIILGLSKILWIEGIHRIPVAKANALNAVGPIFTLLFAWLFLKNVPAVSQVLAVVVVLPGVWLLTRNKTRKKQGILR